MSKPIVKTYGDTDTHSFCTNCEHHFSDHRYGVCMGEHKGEEGEAERIICGCEDFEEPDD